METFWSNDLESDLLYSYSRNYGTDGWGEMIETHNGGDDIVTKCKNKGNGNTQYKTEKKVLFSKNIHGSKSLYIGKILTDKHKKRDY